jgi:hypothetical protein
MAILKVCDNCAKKLGGETPFVQTKGTVSDQYEPGAGKVEFRYLTNGEYNEVHTFCDDDCEMEWRDKQREVKAFSNRS